MQEADYDSINYGGGPGDAYDTLPGFLAPSTANPGWPQAVENYLRLNYNDVRIHQIPATPYMLDIADQRGLMIIDETAIRGSNLRQNFATGLPNMVGDARDLVLREQKPRFGVAMERGQRADLDRSPRRERECRFLPPCTRQ